MQTDKIAITSAASYDVSYAKTYCIYSSNDRFVKYSLSLTTSTLIGYRCVIVLSFNSLPIVICQYGTAVHSAVLCLGLSKTLPAGLY